MADENTKVKKVIPEIEIPQELQELKNLSRNLFEAKVNELFFIDREELKRRSEDPKASTIDIWIARVALRGAQEGDFKTLQFFLDRLIGPVDKGQAPVIAGHMSWVRYIEEKGTDDFKED